MWQSIQRPLYSWHASAMVSRHGSISLLVLICMGSVLEVLQSNSTKLVEEEGVC